MTKERFLTIGTWAQILTMAIGFLCSWIMILAHDRLAKLELKLDRISIQLQDVQAQQMALRTRLDYHEKATQ